MKGIKYVGTRGGEQSVSFSEAVLNPSAKFAGLFIPDNFPKLDCNDLSYMYSLSYQGLALYIAKLYMDDIPEDVIRDSVKVYSNADDSKNPVPLIEVGDNIYVSELWHLLTRAFKDMALAPSPIILDYCAHVNDIKLLILYATSGDTGPAILSAVRNFSNLKTVGFFHKGHTSYIQEMQMRTEFGKNSIVFGTMSDFDKIQQFMKDNLASESFNNFLLERGYKLSALNSVNIIRIIYQMVYHFWSYFELVRKGKIKFGDKIKFIVPSGNFGNALALYYAMKMGLPVEKIGIASNANNVLTDFFKTGCYDLHSRELIMTLSSAMDILKSSGLERLLFDMFGAKRTLELMISLEDCKKFQLTEFEIARIQKIFQAEYATDYETGEYIAEIHRKYKYVADPHTATGFVVRDKLRITDPVIIYSTAEWTKFPEVMGYAIGIDPSLQSLAAFFGTKVSSHISEMLKKPIIHDKTIDLEDVKKHIIDFL